MVDKTKNIVNNQQYVVQPPAELCLKNIQRLVIAVSPYCIRLSDGVRNYQSKTIHFNILPALHGLANEDPLSFIREFYSMVQTFPLNGVSKKIYR